MIDVPFFQKTIGAFNLSLPDWLIVAIPALTILPVLEPTKWLMRQGWFGACNATTERPAP